MTHIRRLGTNSMQNVVTKPVEPDGDLKNEMQKKSLYYKYLEQLFSVISVATSFSFDIYDKNKNHPWCVLYLFYLLSLTFLMLVPLFCCFVCFLLLFLFYILRRSAGWTHQRAGNLQYRFHQHVLHGDDPEAHCLRLFQLLEKSLQCLWWNHCHNKVQPKDSNFSHICSSKAYSWLF